MVPAANILSDCENPGNETARSKCANCLSDPIENHDSPLVNDTRQSNASDDCKNTAQQALPHVSSSQYQAALHNQSVVTACWTVQCDSHEAICQHWLTRPQRAAGEPLYLCRLRPDNACHWSPAQNALCLLRAGIHPQFLHRHGSGLSWHQSTKRLLHRE